MTYLQDATYSSTIVGTSSNGVSQIAYVMPWNDQSHEATDILLIRPKSSEPTDPVQWEYNSDSSESERITQLTLDHTKGSMVEFLDSFISVKHSWFTPTISSDLSSDVITSLYIDLTTSLNPPSVYWCGRFITADIEREVSHKTNIQYSQRREISDQLDILAQWEDNRDRYESKKPTETTLVYAKFLMEEFLDSISSVGHPWLAPFISTDEDGYITVEWHKGERELHFDIEKNEVEYTKIWGTSANMKIHTDPLNRDDYPTLWEWLLDG